MPPVDLTVALRAGIHRAEIGGGSLADGEVEMADRHLTGPREPRAHARRTSVADVRETHKILVDGPVLEIGAKPVLLEVVAPDPSRPGCVALGRVLPGGQHRDDGGATLALAGRNDLSGAGSVAADDARWGDRSRLRIEARPGDVTVHARATLPILEEHDQLPTVAHEQIVGRGDHDHRSYRRGRRSYRYFGGC